MIYVRRNMPCIHFSINAFLLHYVFHLIWQNIFLLNLVLKHFSTVLRDRSPYRFIAVFFSENTHWVYALFLFMVHDLLEIRLQSLTRYLTVFNFSLPIFKGILFCFSFIEIASVCMPTILSSDIKTDVAGVYKFNPTFSSFNLHL